MRAFIRTCLTGLMLVFALAVVPQASASGEFQADYDVQYAIAPTGKTIVTQRVTLTNNLANFYPQEYTLLLDSDKIHNVIAYDDGGIITPVISVKDGKTSIALTFNVKAIGLGKTLPFSLRYEHNGVASKNGSIWEVYIPGVVNDPDIGDYTVSLAVPPTFGPAAYLSPLPANGRSWSKEQMIRGGIAGAYGSAQNFDLSLSYTLSNSGITPVFQDIALPPETAYQKVTIRSLDPSPLTVHADGDGNWLARYQVNPRQSLAVTAKATVSTYLSPRKDFPPAADTKASTLKEDRYWQTKDPSIVKLASQYDTPRKIYDYVSTALRYDYSKINGPAPRMGAIDALKEPSKAVCMEFTDLFIAIARAAGIQARRVVGYAYTNNPKLRPLSLVSDVLHAWPEYYDAESRVWVPVDPTWANTTGGVDYFTKLDFNHITFAINGADSVTPYPAGYYHASDAPGRDVSVEFSQNPKEDGAANVVTSIEFPEQVSAGARVNGALVITNKGSRSAYAIDVSAVSEPAAIKILDTIPELLPYAVVRIPLSGVFEQTVTTKPGQIHARVGDVTLTHSFRIRPLYWLIGIGVATLVVSIMLFVKIIRMTIWKTSHKH